jgi:DNA-binding NarL/FixJ family response regulator
LLLADDHDLVREGIWTMLASEPDLRVIGEAADGREALELCRRMCPDLVLMDVRMPEMDGLEATRAIKAECPSTSVLMLTSHKNPDYLLEAIRAGAAGYILKDATKQQLLDSVRKVLDGESPLDQELAMRLLKRLSNETRRHTEQVLEFNDKPRKEELLSNPLTSREIEVLQRLALGRTNREIAQDLRVSLSTVKGHVHQIITKLGASDRTQAAVRAFELGLLPKQY